MENEEIKDEIKEEEVLETNEEMPEEVKEEEEVV